MRAQPTPAYLSISERVGEKLGKKKNQGDRLFLGKWRELEGKNGGGEMGAGQPWEMEGEKKILRKKNDEEWRFGRGGYEC